MAGGWPGSRARMCLQRPGCGAWLDFILMAQGAGMLPEPIKPGLRLVVLFNQIHVNEVLDSTPQTRMRSCDHVTQVNVTERERERERVMLETFFQNGGSRARPGDRRDCDSLTP